MSARAGDAAIRPGVYQIAATTMMPNLDGMRHDETTEKRCLDGDSPSALFPILTDAAVNGCALRKVNCNDDSFLLYPEL